MFSMFRKGGTSQAAGDTKSGQAASGSITHVSMKVNGKAVSADIDPRMHGAAALSVSAHLEHLIAQGLVWRQGETYRAKD